jgi:tetratricopeptide (TPR) repeat protein
VLFNQRQYDEALKVWKGVLELEPEYGLAIYNQGLVYWMKGMGKEVITSAQQAKTARLSVGELHADWLLTIGYALSGQRDSAQAMLREREFPPALAAAVHHVLGDDDEAIDFLERAVAMRLPGVPNITSEPLFDDLRDHPRFRALRSAMELP